MDLFTLGDGLLTILLPRGTVPVLDALLADICGTMAGVTGAAGIEARCS